MKNMTKKLKMIASIGLLMMAFNSQASDLTIPNQFTSGARAVAADVNANFDAAAAAVTDNQTQLTDLIAQITALTATVNANSATITSLQTDNTNLQAEVDALEVVDTAHAADIAIAIGQSSENQASLSGLRNDLVAGLASYLTVETDNQGNPVAIFSGINVHVNNGLGTTSSINGLGNFIVGYDENTNDLQEECSIGIYQDQTTCESNNEIWAIAHKSGSHNIVVNSGHNYSRAGGLIAGINNSLLNDNASVTGGENNRATNISSSISGGDSNQASGEYSSISGGQSNQALGEYSSVSGGSSNTSSGPSSSVSGGSFNASSGSSSSVSGGNQNSANANWSSVSGGDSNVASGARSVISGGRSRTSSGDDDWVAGALFEDN